LEHIGLESGAVAVQLLAKDPEFVADPVVLLVADLWSGAGWAGGLGRGAGDLRRTRLT
jgi:hypothetical protein